MRREVLAWCLNDADLTASERALMREIVHYNQMGLLTDWGMANQRREQEVFDLFSKCANQLGEARARAA